MASVAVREEFGQMTTRVGAGVPAVATAGTRASRRSQAAPRPLGLLAEASIATSGGAVGSNSTALAVPVGAKVRGASR
jgi:hypothetical protein